MVVPVLVAFGRGRPFSDKNAFLARSNVSVQLREVRYNPNIPACVGEIEAGVVEGHDCRQGVRVSRLQETRMIRLPQSQQMQTRLADTACA